MASDVPHAGGDARAGISTSIATAATFPPGSGSVSHGHEVFDQQCASCHGAKGEGGPRDRLVGGQGHHRDAEAGQDRRSFLPYAPTLSTNIRRAMPQNAPQST